MLLIKGFIKFDTYLLFIKLLFLRSQSLFSLILIFGLLFAHVVASLRPRLDSINPSFGCSSPLLLRFKVQKLVRLISSRTKKSSFIHLLKTRNAQIPFCWIQT